MNQERQVKGLREERKGKDRRFTGIGRDDVTTKYERSSLEIPIQDDAQEYLVSITHRVSSQRRRLNVQGKMKRRGSPVFGEKNNITFIIDTGAKELKF